MRSNNLRKVRIVALNPNTAPFFPAFTNPAWRIVTGDEKVAWNTAVNYRHAPEPTLALRTCDCALACGLCNCFSRG